MSVYAFLCMYGIHAMPSGRRTTAGPEARGLGVVGQAEGRAGTGAGDAAAALVLVVVRGGGCAFLHVERALYGRIGCVCFGGLGGTHTDVCIGLSRASQAHVPAWG